MISSNYSPLIDVLKFHYYNIDMEENTFVNLIAIEIAEPKWRITRSVGAIYVALLALIIGCISIGNILYQNWQIPRFLTQPVLYVLIALCALYLYQRHFVRFRYTLTDELLVIEKIGASSEKNIAVIALTDIKAIISPHEKKKLSGKVVYASLPPSESATWIVTRAEKQDILYSISATEEWIAQAEAARHEAATAEEHIL